MRILQTRDNRLTFYFSIQYITRQGTRSRPEIFYISPTELRGIKIPGEKSSKEDH